MRCFRQNPINMYLLREAVRDKSPDFVGTGDVQELALGEEASLRHIRTLDKRPGFDVSDLNLPG